MVRSRNLGLRLFFILPLLTGRAQFDRNAKFLLTLILVGVKSVAAFVLLCNFAVKTEVETNLLPAWVSGFSSC